MKLLSLFSLSAIVLGANCVMQLENDRVCFSRQENGLEWPLPNIKNPGILISHVAHCFKVALNPLKSPNAGDRLHHGHCLELVNRTLHFLSDNSGYKVDSWICDALRQSYGWNQRQWDAGVWGDWTASLDRAKRDAMVHMHGTEDSGQKDQNAAYTTLASKNFGKYLIANMTNPESLGQAERKYIRVWDNEEAVALGAVGLYCYVNGDLNVIRGALDL